MMLLISSFGSCARLLPDVVSVTAVAAAYDASQVPWRSFRELFAFVAETRLQPDGVTLAYGLSAGASHLTEQLQERGIHFARSAV